jgi:hypothetical protein
MISAVECGMFGTIYSQERRRGTSTLQGKCLCLSLLSRLVSRPLPSTL